MTTDYKALCAELLTALEIQLDELRFNNRLCARARAALAESKPPADGEVAELVAWLREIAQLWEPDAPRAKQLFRAAELLERLAPQPVPEGPTNHDIEVLNHAVFVSRLQGPPPNTSFEVDLVRAALARWGQS